MTKLVQAAINAAKPTTVGMKIQTGMLESMGINMYTSIGKSLVEFVANSFDAEASKVELLIPFEEIDTARTIIRNQAIKDGKTEVYTPLPASIEIIIEDDGHGMTVDELENKFLKINRNRRKETGSNKSENGKRSVMGRKGLGKLAGFGVAEQVIIRTKKLGEDYATTIVMDYAEIEKEDHIGNVTFPTEYEHGLDPKTSGTKITLRKLRCDSFKYKEDSIEAILSRNFYITGNDFKINMNGAEIKELDVHYEFSYPDPQDCVHAGLAESNVKVHEGFEFPIRYIVKFRARTDEKNKDGRERGHLRADMRGARVYCNQRLAAGPSLFNLATGMHNFHANAYMECLVDADVLDEGETDLIGTNRAGLKNDNEIVDAFVNHVTELMRLAIYEHSKFREKEVTRELDEDTVGKAIQKTINHVPTKVRVPAKKLLNAIGIQYGVGTAEFNEIAPLVADSINAGDVLIKLIELGTNPKDLATIANHLTDLANVEKTDVLKAYRGRRSAITALLKLINEGEDNWKTGPRTENKLQELFKKSPWLIRVDYSNYVTSDESMDKVVTSLARELKVDKFHTSTANDDSDARRPDLVFLMSDTSHPHQITIVELKSPNLPLDSTHLDQLKDYIAATEAWLKTEHPKLTCSVNGILIGAMPDKDTKAKDCVRLMFEIEKNNGQQPWEVFGLNELFQKTKAQHIDIIEAIAKEQQDEELTDEVQDANKKKAKAV